MQIKGQHIVEYSLKGEKGKIEARVELKQHDGPFQPRQNLWYAIIILNDREIDHPDAPYCVNAQYMAEAVVEEELQKLRSKHGPALRVKRNKKK